MAGMTDGEMVIIIAEKHYRLRPSIRALCRIESQTNLTTQALIAATAASGLPAFTLRPILREGIKAAENIGDDVPVSDDQLVAAAPHLFAFLLQGLGHEPIFPGMTDPGVMKNIRQPNWQDIFKTYMGVMGRPVQEFWQMTLVEYALAFEGFCLVHKIDGLSASAPATATDVAELLQQFPDEMSASVNGIHSAAENSGSAGKKAV